MPEINQQQTYKQTVPDGWTMIKGCLIDYSMTVTTDEIGHHHAEKIITWTAEI